MSFARRSGRRPQLRRRNQTLPLSFDDTTFHIFIPSPDEPIVLAEFADAISLAWAVLDLPVQREVLALVDERRLVTALLVDPPPSIGLMIGWCNLPGLDVPFCQTLSYVVGDAVPDGPPDPADVFGYQSLRRTHMLQGLQLMDVILVDSERILSLATTCDPDPIWLDPFEPLDQEQQPAA